MIGYSSPVNTMAWLLFVAVIVIGFVSYGLSIDKITIETDYYDEYKECNVELKEATKPECAPCKSSDTFLTIFFYIMGITTGFMGAKVWTEIILKEKHNQKLKGGKQ